LSEPHEMASEVREVTPGVWHWCIHDDRIDYVSDAYAVAVDGGLVLIDPLPLAEQPLRRLGAVAAICHTCGSHQRSAWRYRRDLGAPVYAPALAREIDEEPDKRYGDSDLLTGGLRAVFTPGAGTTQHTLVREGEPGVAFCPDLLVRPEGGVALVRVEEYDSEQARRSIERLLELPFSLLCLTHGGIVSEEPKVAIRAVLRA
jgi:glyoxylase-like metal-dependent hydrolase (beta-lactamase superfamily II)